MRSVLVMVVGFFLSSQAAQAQRRPNIRVMPDGSGWWCFANPTGFGICHRTILDCRAQAIEWTGASDCSYQKRAGCFTFHRKLQRTSEYRCLSTFASCKRARKFFTSTRDDFSRVSRCVGWDELPKHERRRRKRVAAAARRKAERSTKGQPAIRDNPGTAGVSPGPTSGSCFVVDPAGVVVTNKHVVDGRKEIRVYHFASATWYDTLSVKISPTHDLAVIEVDEVFDVHLPVASGDATKPGTRVFTYGFPAPSSLGPEAKFTDGVLSSRSVPGVADWFQISVPVQPGNSGGPLVTEDGHAIGVVTARVHDLEFYRRTKSLPQNINFAIKADALLDILPKVVPAERITSREDAIERARKSICMVHAK